MVREAWMMLTLLPSISTHFTGTSYIIDAPFRPYLNHETQAARHIQNLDVERPSLQVERRKNAPRHSPREQLKSTLGVVDPVNSR